MHIANVRGLAMYLKDCVAKEAESVGVRNTIYVNLYTKYD